VVQILDKLKKLGGEIITKIKNKKLSMKEESEQQAKLKKFQDKFSEARTGIDEAIRDEREAIYLGTKIVDGNVNARSSSGKRKQANNVVNLVLEFIETGVDSTIPQPSVRTKLPGYEVQATMIEDSLTADITELGMTAINDINERITPVQGYSAMLVGWNPDFRHHLYRGELEIESIHPKRIIPQPGVFDLQKMDYFFILSSVTKNYIKKRYDVDLENVGEQFPNISLVSNTTQPNNPDMVTEIVCWYKNDDGEVSKLVWCEDEILEDMENFYARRIDGKIQEFEELGTEVTLSSVNGQPGEVLPVGTKVPYFTPTRYPLIIRENIPLNFAFGGQSDVDVIRDQQDAYKKVVSTIEEKILRGSVVVTALEGHRFNLSNELYGIIRGTQPELNALNVKNLSANISNDLAFAQQQYKAAQSTLGITNSYQGKSDSTAVSGLAKQIQVQQASGRLRSKESNKYAAFKDMYQTMFEFKLAFYDELRPFVTKDANGQDSFGDFNKYAFLVRDKAGELYYNTDFIFQADAGAGLPRDKMWLFNQATEMLKYGAYNPGPASVVLWTQLVAQKFPNAKAILDSINKQLEAQAKAPPAQPESKVSINYEDLMPDAQSQMLGKMGIKSQGGQPEQMGQLLQMPQPNATPQQPAQPQEMPPQATEQPMEPQQPQPQGSPQEQVQQVLEQAMQHMSEEERQAFAQLPEEKKIEIVQQLMAQEVNSNG